MEIVGIITLGVMYLSSFGCITYLLINGKDTNVLVTLITGITTALIGLINIRRSNSTSMDAQPQTEPATLEREYNGGENSDDR
jgi:hypothetical protein